MKKERETSDFERKDGQYYQEYYDKEDENEKVLISVDITFKNDKNKRDKATSNLNGSDFPDSTADPSSELPDPLILLPDMA
ncbi:DgyrCDS7065 [Dimorphilus gyrociliatus]|uniref:DgyrCDS7065 n=1 Tax=Dimorphilus gyrociliatus TaxID=2664684 RepID=A0A7I8VPW9_9ANNE|nr:DgyrCDS7065 [Dimorphilus gyrociliatus]